ncbi:MAG TPA: Lrp/AsnC family transcriptional regulator [Spongiibacteraceae bacterium]|nr:AsnC family transcriptional regulator [Spongiibacteraceae bacterium]HCS28088.1 Lrp/AsnC family transcriptional regulator [Spongiibacteraceae bacterium]|tara:strand:+ start:1739 stop:2206 length:468 start_codon:yes stop_codon:yes gene_type:complete
MSKRRLDELDQKIVSALARDARTSNRKIATELGVTEGTVRARIKRMEEEGQIRITAVTNIDHLRNPTLAYIWIEVDSAAQVQAVAAALAEVQQIGFVAVTLGRFDILAITLVQNNGQLADFLNSRVSVIPGVRRTECSLGVTFVKHDYRMSKILA